MSQRKATRFPGVHSRESETRTYKGKPDVCFTIDYRDANGKRIRKDIGWASQGFTATLANEMRLKLVHDAKMQSAMGESSQTKRLDPTFQEAWGRYRSDWLEANHKHVTYPASVVKLHLSSLMELPLSRITPLVLEQIMGEMRKKGLSPQSIRHAIGIVSSVMRRMIKWKLYTGNLPFDSITLPKPNNRRERFLTPEEAHKLLAEIRRRSERTWLMALVSLHCGLRFGEIARMKWEDVNFSEMSIYIPESKNGCARHAVMTREVADALRNFEPACGLVFPDRNGLVSDSISKAFFRAVDACGLNEGASGKISDRRQKVVFHTLRHTYASWLAKSGQSQFVIADRLGHHSLQMTYRYTHLQDDSRKASAAAISAIFQNSSPESQ